MARRVNFTKTSRAHAQQKTQTRAHRNDKRTRDYFGLFSESRDLVAVDGWTRCPDDAQQQRGRRFNIPGVRAARGTFLSRTRTNTRLEIANERRARARESCEQCVLNCERRSVLCSSKTGR